jgi:predicted amidophosphoribosyltransferase
MLCLACAAPGGPLCRACSTTLAPPYPRVIDGVVAEAPFRHHGAAARLVTHVKYRRNLAAARFLAIEMSRLVPAAATVLVPVPRAMVRRVRYGIDPSLELARLIGGRLDLPVEASLSAPWWWRRRAGTARTGRGPVPFTGRAPSSDGAVLVDDVLTTGATAASALVAIDGRCVSILTATSAGNMGEEP